MRRQSAKRKALHGTLRGCHAPESPSAATRLNSAPSAPRGLSPSARAEWSRLAALGVELGVLSGADLRALQLLAETLATESELRRVIAREGHTIPASSGGRKAHPALKALAEARAQSMRLLAAFGMTPLGRQSVDPAPAPKRPNVFALIKAGGYQSLGGEEAQ